MVGADNNAYCLVTVISWDLQNENWYTLRSMPLEITTNLNRKGIKKVKGLTSRLF